MLTKKELEQLGGKKPKRSRRKKIPEGLSAEGIIRRMIPEHDSRRQEFLDSKHMISALNALIADDPDSAISKCATLFNLLSPYARQAFYEHQTNCDNLKEVIEHIREAAVLLHECDVPGHIDAAYDEPLQAHLVSIASALDQSNTLDSMDLLKLSPELIGKRGGGEKKDGRYRGWIICELDRIIPQPCNNRYALIAAVSSFVAKDVKPPLVRTVLNDRLRRPK